jgi:biotin carboxyl carrier protein
MNTVVAKSDINGAVWKILVQPGQTVSAGDSLALIESMKMEIPVIAEVAGVVAIVHVNEGDSVSPGHSIVTLES